MTSKQKKSKQPKYTNKAHKAPKSKKKQTEHMKIFESGERRIPVVLFISVPVFNFIC